LKQRVHGERRSGYISISRNPAPQCMITPFNSLYAAASLPERGHVDLMTTHVSHTFSGMKHRYVTRVAFVFHP
jgi:hypothetical protein